MTAYVLSGYPLSRPYREALRSHIEGDLQPVLLQELRQAGAISALRALRSLSGDALYVAMEDPSSVAMLPVLRIAAALTRVRNRFVVDDALRVSPIGLGDGLAASAGLVGASLDSSARAARASVRASRLAKVDRLPLRATGKRVLYLNANLWFGVKAGGSVGHISGVVNAFHKEGYEVLFSSAGGRLMVKQAIPYEPLKAPRWFGVPWETNYYSFDDRVVRQIESTARTFGPSFIYQRMSLGNTSGVRLSRRLRVPLVLEYNGSEVWVARNWGKPLRLERAALLAEEVSLRHAHFVVTISDALRDELRTRGVEPSRIVTYPNCIDPEIFDPNRFSDQQRAALRAKYGIERDATVVTFLGSFGQWHGVPVLAHAIRRLIETDKPLLDAHCVRFLLIGDGLKMPEVRQILGAHAEGAYVRLIGLVPQDAAPLHLAASDILSSPHVPNGDGSRFFGSPTKLFEYMAMAKGIVASDLDQLGEVLNPAIQIRELPGNAEIARQSLAILCRPGSVEEHLQGVKFLIREPRIRKQLGINAREEALRRYTWTSHVRHILSYLERA